MERQKKEKTISIGDSFQDEDGNLLFFCERNLDGHFKRYLCIDGADCAEGIVEEWNGTLAACLDILHDYGYTALKEAVQTAFWKCPGYAENHSV